MLDVRIQSPDLPGHTLLLFIFFPLSLWILYCANCQDLSFRSLIVSSLGYHQEIKISREWKVARNEIPGFKALDQVGREK